MTTELPRQDVQHQLEIARPLVGPVHHARTAGWVVAPPVHYARHGVYEGVVAHAPVHELVELGTVIPPPLVVGLEGLDPVEEAGDPLELLELVGMADHLGVLTEVDCWIPRFSALVGRSLSPANS